MGSVRSAPKFNEQGIELLTFTYDSSIVYDSSFYDGANHSAQVGLAVTLVGNGQVGLGSAGGILAGKLVSVEPDSCTVAVSGVLQLPAATTNPPLLGHGVTVDGTGKVSSAATAVVAERGRVIHPSYTADDGSTVAVVGLGRG